MPDLVCLVQNSMPEAHFKPLTVTYSNLWFIVTLIILNYPLRFVLRHGCKSNGDLYCGNQEMDTAR